MTDWTIAVCIASGPSLTAEDCDQVRQSGLPTIVTNNTWQLCPWAHTLYAMDRAWWSQYGERAKHFAGNKVTAVRGAKVAEHVAFQHGRNSGYGAIALAAKWGARRIILLGYDCQFTGGMRHWHGNHEKGLGNAEKIRNWPNEFARLQKRMKSEGREVINCTRETALTCFIQAPLGWTLAQPLSLPAAPALPGSSHPKAASASPSMAPLSA
ncbi:hypothetical protein [uncultured Microbulbifer sp.]|uniref:hypothetical protein n=1 Tax=uncultured Microbulbifer sp. TaxID=348147 RepID=UPI0025E02E44|nr:hypothetical protein [uncultured Microbulbifer sp.]